MKHDNRLDDSTRYLFPLLVLAFFLLTGLFSGKSVFADEQPSQTTQYYHYSLLVSDKVIPVYIYRPARCETYAVLFVFHGQKRNAEQYRGYAQRFAQSECMLLAVPKFSKKQFPNWRYQRGGLIRKGRIYPQEQWTITLVRDLIKQVMERERLNDRPFYLFGHSAGAQFLSRVSAFAAPEKVTHMVLANASSYIEASLDTTVPYGMGGVYQGEEARARLRQYLQQPITIYLGGADTGSKSLHNHPQARKQGANRLQRGMFIFHSAERLAKQNGWVFNWTLVIAPGVGHNARNMLDSPAAQKAFALTE